MQTARRLTEDVGPGRGLKREHDAPPTGRIAAYGPRDQEI